MRETPAETSLRALARRALPSPPRRHLPPLPPRRAAKTLSTEEHKARGYGKRAYTKEWFTPAGVKDDGSEVFAEHARA